jgi:ABC-type sugar transport system ATPase subunit
LGVGQRQLVEIARLLARNANLLILDEPTATLNDREIERMIGVLKGLRDRGHSILYITHRLGEIFDLCDSVSVLRNGEHVLTAPVPGLKRDQLIHAMLGREFSELYPKRGPPAQANQHIVVEGLSSGAAFRNVSFTANSGQILGIAGQVGSGASLLTRALAGLVHEANGRVTIDGAILPLGSPSACIGRNVLFVTDDRAAEGIFPQLSVLENIVATNIHRLSPRGLVLWRRLRRHGVKNATRVGINPCQLDVAASNLSGGNQQKLLFGRALRDGAPGILLLNEPTRGIDVGARSEIYKLMRTLCGMGYVLIMYSSDLEEIVGMADAVITIYRGTLVAKYDAGSIDTAQILSDITHPVLAGASTT